MMKKVIVGVAITSMAAGASGMLFSFFYLWSEMMADLVGAGFSFLAGAVLFGSGLITLGLLNR